MQLTIEIANEQLFEKIISNTKDKYKPISKSSKDGLNFSSFKVDSFKEVDGLEYQKGIRNEW